MMIGIEKNVAESPDQLKAEKSGARNKGISKQYSQRAQFSRDSLRSVCYGKEVKETTLKDAEAMEKSVDRTSGERETEGKSLGKRRELGD